MRKANNSSRGDTEKWVDGIKDHLWLFSLFNYSYNSSIRCCRIKPTRVQTADKKKRKNKMFSLISLSQSYTHKPETHTHRDTRTEAVNGTTEVLWVAVSQTLFLEQRINSRPSLPRHRHSAHSCSWQSRLSHLPFLDLCQNSLTIHHFLFLLYFTPYFCLFLFYLIFLLLLNSQSSR